MLQQTAISVLVATGLLLSSGPVAIGQEKPQPKPGEDLKQVEQDIKAGKERQQQLKSTLNNLGQREDDLQERLIDAARAAQDQEASVIDIENRLVKLEREREKRHQSLILQRKELEKSLNGLQKLARRPPLSLAAQPDKKLVDSLRAAELLAALVPVYEEKAEKLRRELEALAGLERNIRTELVSLDEKRQLLDIERRALVTLLARTERDRKRMRNQTRDEQQRMAGLAAKSQNLRGLIAKLQEEQAKRSEPPPQKPRKKPLRNTDTETNTGSRVTEQTKPVPRPSIAGSAPNMRKFVKARGKLTRPVAGPLRQAYGRKNKKNLTSKGIEIETRAESAVLAPWDGKIAFAGPYRGYGQVLIIQHSDGYHTLLSGLSRLYGVSGQYVLAGEPMGEMAATPDRQRLYLELRKGSDPIDPSPWLRRKGNS